MLLAPGWFLPVGSLDSYLLFWKTRKVSDLGQAWGCLWILLSSGFIQRFDCGGAAMVVGTPALLISVTLSGIQAKNKVYSMKLAIDHGILDFLTGHQRPETWRQAGFRNWWAESPDSVWQLNELSQCRLCLEFQCDLLGLFLRDSRGSV